MFFPFIFLQSGLPVTDAKFSMYDILTDQKKVGEILAAQKPVWTPGMTELNLKLHCELHDSRRQVCIKIWYSSYINIFLIFLSYS